MNAVVRVPRECMEFSVHDSDEHVSLALKQTGHNHLTEDLASFRITHCIQTLPPRLTRDLGLLCGQAVLNSTT